MAKNPKADEHIIEAIGRCRIVIRDGTVVEVGESQIRDCPLAKRFAYPIPDITKESVKANIEHRIKAFGMCTPDREVLDNREFVGFGASEILSFGLRAGLIDAVVLTCDGAGTIIVTTPALVQGIGGRMSGLVSTSPYPSVMDRIEGSGGYVLDRENASIDQLAGVALAVEKGFRNIAVTVALPRDAQAIRRIHPSAVIFGVHVTGLSAEEAEMLVSASDLVTSCASKTIREIAGKKALVQAGIAIPIFAITKPGKEFIIEKIRTSDEPVLVKPTKLPALGDKQPDPLI
ncbi:methanogenesis marker 8 protein [uncultured Methanoregula sp.]|uniref:methanogenesis marker 8 protein n=1 Tax=uncultured Methanoregula sp. TaxID=1005933 RepID=UPI002AAA72B6|nr:methanogenesis marker 8 protein [uncultured Methanoregula sp.]